MSEMEAMPGLEAIKAVGCIHKGNTIDTDPDRPQKESPTKSLLITRSCPGEKLEVMRGYASNSMTCKYSFAG